MISDYLKHLEAKGYGKSMVSAAVRWLGHLERHFGGRQLIDLKAEDLTAFQQGLHWQPGPRGKLYAEHTVNQAVLAVRGFYRWAVLGGLMAKDPAAHLVTKSIPPKPRYEFSPTQARKLLFQASSAQFQGLRDRAVLGLVLETRASCGAMSRLDLDDFQADMAAILLQGRGREILSLSEGLIDDIVRYLCEGRPGFAQSSETALFVGRHGRRINPESFSAIIRTHIQRAGVPSPYATPSLSR